MMSRTFVLVSIFIWSVHSTEMCRTTTTITVAAALPAADAGIGVSFGSVGAVNIADEVVYV